VHRRIQHDYFGSAHHARKDFVGVPKSVRETNRDRMLVRTKSERLQGERLLKFDPENFGTPIERQVSD
jgi:hypothetical protein